MYMAILLLAQSCIASADELFGRSSSLSLDTQEQDILSVDEAFRFSSSKESDGYRVFWQVAPDYFLYRDKFAFRAGDIEVEVEMEEGSWYQDETFGKVKVLGGLVEVLIPNFSKSVSIHYQGCAVKGFCYPPQKKLITSEKSAKNLENH
jgi:thioredoxin:protein disulfide reductase